VYPLTATTWGGLVSWWCVTRERESQLSQIMSFYFFFNFFNLFKSAFYLFNFYLPLQWLFLFTFSLLYLEGRGGG